MSSSTAVPQALANKYIEVFWAAAAGFQKPLILDSIRKVTARLPYFARLDSALGSTIFHLMHLDSRRHFMKTVPFLDQTKKEDIEVGTGLKLAARATQLHGCEEQCSVSKNSAEGCS